MRANLAGIVEKTAMEIDGSELPEPCSNELRLASHNQKFVDLQLQALKYLVHLDVTHLHFTCKC